MFIETKVILFFFRLGLPESEPEEEFLKGP